MSAARHGLLADAAFHLPDVADELSVRVGAAERCLDKAPMGDSSSNASRAGNLSILNHQSILGRSLTASSSRFYRDIPHAVVGRFRASGHRER
jgi:hypothetical protein